MRRASRAFAGAALLLALFAVQCAADTIDQQQLIYDSGVSARTLPGYTVWQSFTAGLSGTMTEIDMGFFENMSGDGTLRIDAGQGTGGMLLLTMNVTVIGITQPEVTWNYWFVNVPITAGLQYTFELTPDALTLPDPYGVAAGSNSPYSGGVFGLNDPSGSRVTTFDAVFRTYVAGRLATPEPASLLLLGTALCGLAWLARRRRID